MRLVFSAVLVVATASAANAEIQTFLSTAVNPFGVPAVGTGVAVYAETTGTEPVTAQAWALSGNIVNNDAPATSGFLADPNKVQTAGETALANIFDAATSTQWEADDSYWGDYFTSALLGAGFNGSGGANPGGAGISNMELEGGTTFGSNPAATELLLYVVITNPVEITGALAIGSTQLEEFGPTPMGGPWGLYPDGSIQELGVVPEPSTFALGSLCLLGLAMRRRRRAA